MLATPSPSRFLLIPKQHVGDVESKTQISYHLHVESVNKNDKGTFADGPVVETCTSTVGWGRGGHVFNF